MPGSAIGVPGTVAGLALAHQKYGSGRLTLAQLIAPAIALARNGFIIEGDLADTLASATAAIRALAVVGENFLQGRRDPVRAETS